jgi:HK97 family phage major capsid protein
MNIDQKRARLDEVRSNLLAIAERGTDLEGEDAENWESLNSEFDSLREAIAGHEAREARVAEVRAFAMNPANVETTSPQVMRKVESDGYDIRSMSPMERSDTARKIIEEYRGLTAEQRERVEDLVVGGYDDADFTEDTLPSRATELVLRTGRKQYRSAFRKILKDHDLAPMILTDEEKRAVVESRAMSTADGGGGYAIPFGLDPTFLYIGNGATNPFRQISRQITTGAIDQWRSTTVTEVSASYDAEAAEVGDDTPTWAQPTIDLYKAAAFIPISYEALGDIANIESEVRRLLDDAKNRLEAQQFATGSGTSQPWGIVNALSPVAASLVTVATRGTFAVADVYSLQEAIPARWEGENLSFVGHKNVLNDIRQFGTSNNYHGFTVDLTQAGPSKVMGSPFYTSSGVTSTITTGNHILVYGDFSNFYLVDRLGMTMNFIPALFSTGSARPTGQAGWYAYWRHGSDSVNDNAFRLLKL